MVKIWGVKGVIHNKNMRSSTILSLPYLAFLTRVCLGYVPQEILQQWKQDKYGMRDALKTIEERAPERFNEDRELYYAVRYIDRNGHLFYSSQEERDALWEKANGSWELLMGYEDPKKDLDFIPYPDFRDFAMAFVIIDTDDNYFGKGIASNPDFSFVAMGGPSKVNERTRQLYMDYQDFYISGQQVYGWDLSYFMRGYARNWYSIERNRPPLAFTLIGVTDKILVVRGSKTGGMAIFRRLNADMRESAYGSKPWKERVTGFWKNSLPKVKVGPQKK
eukprot:scaffold26851_cov186-Cylindrotheca_fusiformis.AAC.2